MDFASIHGFRQKMSVRKNSNPKQDKITNKTDWARSNDSFVLKTGLINTHSLGIFPRRSSTN